MGRQRIKAHDAARNPAVPDPQLQGVMAKLHNSGYWLVKALPCSIRLPHPSLDCNDWRVLTLLTADTLGLTHLNIYVGEALRNRTFHQLPDEAGVVLE